MIFVFEVHIGPETSAERYAEAWTRASAIIQSAVGARGTRLHRKIGAPDVLLAIASWDSKDDRDAAQRKRDPRVSDILREQAEFVEVRVLGSYEEPDWVVLPERPDDAGPLE